MQCSYRLLTALYLLVTFTQSQLFQDNSEGDGEVLQSFQFGSPQIESAGSISPEKFQADTFSLSSSGATLSADLSQPLSNLEQPAPVDLRFTQGAVVDGPGAIAFDRAKLNPPSYLTQQPEPFISQSQQAQPDPPELGQDLGRMLQPASDLIAQGCGSSSAGKTQEVLEYPSGQQAERPGTRAKINMLRPRQGNFCPVQPPSANTPSKISKETEISIDNQNPAFYPGGWLRYGKDIITGQRLKNLKQCTRDTVTLCCNGPQAGPDVSDCAFFSATSEPRCYQGGIWCCNRLSWFSLPPGWERTGKTCAALFYRPKGM